VVRSRADGSALTLGEVARVVLGAEDYSIIGRYNGRPSSGVAISLATNANSLETARSVEALVKQLQPAFPAASRRCYPRHDPFVTASIKDV